MNHSDLVAKLKASAYRHDCGDPTCPANGHVFVSRANLLEFFAEVCPEELPLALVEAFTSIHVIGAVGVPTNSSERLQ